MSVSVETMVRNVEEFHRKHGFPVNERISSLMPFHGLIAAFGKVLLHTAEEWKNQGLLEQENGDTRLYRAHLMVEELGELLVAMARADAPRVLDGGMDLLYVLIGTLSVTFNMPIEEAWIELQKSNMSKSKRNPVLDPRMRSKGPDYTPPDFEKILRQHYCDHEWEVKGSQAVGERTVQCRKCDLVNKEFL